MPEGLTMEDQIVRAVTGGHCRCGQIAAAIGGNIVEVAYRFDAMRDRYLLDSGVRQQRNRESP